jgi:hypothetical protein
MTLTVGTKVGSYEITGAGGMGEVYCARDSVPTGVKMPYYDVSPDGQRFLMLKSTEQAGNAPTQINVVLNWFEELKQKVPVGTK